MNQPGGAEKYRQLEQNSLAIIRLHDAWDRWPDIGIPWAWARFLDLDGEPTTIGNRSFQHRYDITPIPFGEFAKRVASKTAQIGEPCIETIGETNKLISRIRIGTGCYCSIFSYIEMGCDCCIVCDDGAKYWQESQYAEDMGISVICVNHATSEEPGILTLTDYINKHLNQVSATYLAQGCRYVHICA